MPNFKIASRLAALASVLVLSLTACGGGGDDPSDPPVQASLGTVQGVVADVQTGAPIAGVEVKIGALVTTSDASGKFSIDRVPAGAEVVAQFTKAQYASNFATVEVAKDATSVANRRMAKVAITQDVDAASGGTVTLQGSPAQVQLPAAGLVNAATGVAFSGVASVEMTPIDAGLNPLIMPGNYRAQGEAVPIESFGALQVEMRDSKGALLNLAPGKTATIRIPVPVGTNSPPLTMPLYFFKEATGLWVREGTAILAGNPPQQYYEGTVTHFTVWNADMPQETIYINGCVVDKNNQPVSATVTSLGIDYNGSASVQTKVGGLFRVPARINSKVQVTAESRDSSTSVVVTTGSTDITLPACLVIDEKPPVIIVQPVNLTVEQGFFGELSVTANNATQYEWYRNGTLVASGSRRYQLIGGTDTAGSYHVVVSNKYGSVTSNTVTVKVEPPKVLPIIVSEPKDLRVVVGANASFAVEVQGDSISYQWLRNGVEIAGARGPRLNLGAAVLNDDGARFACRISNLVGTVVSASATLNVSPIPVAPVIVQHPANASITLGERATFAVLVSGTAPLSYQWLLNGTVIPGATESTYQTPVATLADNGAKFSVRVTNNQGNVTSNAGTLTVSAGSNVAGLYLPFMQGAKVNEDFSIAAIPVGGGTPTSFLPAGQGMIAAMLMQGQVNDGNVSNVSVRGYVYWRGDQLLRRDLVGTAGLPAEVRISSITASGGCNLDAWEGGGTVSSGGDVNDPNRSWVIVQKQGADMSCDTDDDRYYAVRADMGPATAAIEVARPLTSLHGTNGALTGWVVRNGQQIQRLSADFQNPVTLFTLPADDLESREEADLGNYWVFSSGGRVFAVDLSAAAPVTPSLVATLVGDEFVEGVTNANRSDLIVTIGDAAATRVVRFSKLNKATNAVGSVSSLGSVLAVTPTRVLMRGPLGSVLSMPLTGGTATTIYTPPGQRFSFLTRQGGERIWLDMQDFVVSLNSDGSGVQTLQGAQLAGCVHKPVAVLEGNDLSCDGVLVVQGNVVRSYDAQTGAARITYGNVSPPAASMVSMYAMTTLTAWGQAGVLSQIVSSSTDPNQQAIVNYYFKSDQAGLTPIVMP